MSPSLFLSRFKGVRKNKGEGGGWSARCPAHGQDKKPSLSINTNKDGDILVHCHAGCSVQDICSAIGIGVRDLFLEKNTLDEPMKKKLVKTYLYREPDGKPCLRIMRYEPKTFRQQRWDGNDWNWKGDKPKLLYNLPELLAQPERLVMLVEGEKDADLLSSKGFLATCNPGGAGKFREEYVSPLENRIVVLVADNDLSGAKDVVQKAQYLIGKCEVRILELEGLPIGGDISDWFSDNGNSASLLKELITKTPKLTRENLESLGEKLSKQATDVTEKSNNPEWLEPSPLPGDLVEVLPFNELLLPDNLRPFVLDVTHRMQCPVEYTAVACMVTLASVVGTQITIRPKQKDSWTVTGNLWGCVIGEPGQMKTPALNEFMSFVKDIHRRHKEEYDSKMEEFSEEVWLWEDEKKFVTDQIKKSFRAGDAAKGRSLRKELMAKEPQPPVRKRLFVNDATTESITQILADNHNGILLYRDELLGWIRSIANSHTSDSRAFFLECWNGDGSFEMSRVSRKCKDVPHATISILGGVQPGPLRHYLSNAYEEIKQAGLLQRLQLSVWPTQTKSRIYTDQAPSASSRALAKKTYERLEKINLADYEAEGGSGTTPFTRFTPEAQEIFVDWYKELEEDLSSQAYHSALMSHLSKFRSLIPALALLLHLASEDTGRVSKSALLAAIGWGEVLRSHCNRIYAQTGSNKSISAAREIARHIKSGKLPSEFTARFIKRKEWRGVHQSLVDPALRELELLNWLMSETTRNKKGGRAHTKYIVNPKIAEMKDA